MALPSTSSSTGTSTASPSSSDLPTTPSDAYFAALAGNTEKSSEYMRRDSSPLVPFGSVRSEPAPGARRVPRGGIMPRTQPPINTTEMGRALPRKSPRADAEPPSATSSTSTTETSPRPSGVRKNEGKKDGASDSESDLLFGSAATTNVASPPTQRVGSVRDSISRINAIAERPISPETKKITASRARPGSVYRTSGSISETSVSSNPTAPESVTSPTSYSPLWRLSKSSAKRKEPTLPKSSPSPGSVGSLGGNLADVDSPPQSLSESFMSSRSKPQHRVKVTTHSNLQDPGTEADLSPNDNDSDLDPAFSMSRSSSKFDPYEFGEDSLDNPSEFLSSYRPPIVPVSLKHGGPRSAEGTTLSSLAGGSVSNATGLVSPVSSLPSHFADDAMSASSSITDTPQFLLSPLSETISTSRIAPLYEQHAGPKGEFVPGSSPPEKRIVAIAPHPAIHQPNQIERHFDLRPTRREMRQTMLLSSGTRDERAATIGGPVGHVPGATASPPLVGVGLGGYSSMKVLGSAGAVLNGPSSTSAAPTITSGATTSSTVARVAVDRSDWVTKVMRRNPDLSNLRDRIRPLSRAISFCEIYNRGRGKMSISNDVILQLIMQYFDHEGLRGALKVLEKESDTAFQFRNSDEFQLKDSRLISLLMIALNDIETIWDIAMGEKASTRLTSQILESSSSSSAVPHSPIPSGVNSHYTSSSTFSTPSKPFRREGSTELTSSVSSAASPAPSIPSHAHDNYDETQIGMTQDPEVTAKNMEILTDLLATLRLREQDQFIGYNGAIQAVLANDINIWEDPYDDQLIVEQDTGQVVSGSLNRLVELLTPEEEVDLTYVRAFLVTYQLFTNSSVLLAKLAQRYNAPRDPSMTDEEHKRRVLPIQIRVVNVIKMWIEEFHSDFDDATVSNIRDFFNFQVRETRPALAATSLTLLEKFCSRDGDQHESYFSGTRSGSGSKIVEFSFSADPPRPIVPKNIFSPNLTWEDVEDEELARQLTLIEFEGFYKIRTSEFLHQSWSKAKYKHRAPHILAVIRRFNAVSEWVGTQIVLASKLRNRVRILTKLIGIADHLRQLQNYNTLMAFVAMFNSSAIHRLKHTFSELSPKAAETLSDLKRLMRADDAYKNYLQQLDTSMPPCVPYLGLYLTELTHAEEASPNEIDGLINFAKCRHIHSIIAHINSHQQKGYNLQAVYQIQSFLRDPQPRLSDKAIFSHSSLIEPRGIDKSQLL